jgi:hypothetical protein
MKMLDAGEFERAIWLFIFLVGVFAFLIGALLTWAFL